jgi:hypothetical protein
VDESTPFIRAIYVFFGVVRENYGIPPDLERCYAVPVCPQCYFVVISTILKTDESMQKCGVITLKQQVGAGLQMNENPLAYRHPTLLHALR